MSDFGLNKLKRTIYFLKYPAANPTKAGYLSKTRNDPDIIKASEDSPTFGFLKIRNLLLQNPMDRIKYLNVKDHMSDKFGWKDRWAQLRTIPQMIGAVKRMLTQFRKLKSNHTVISRQYTPTEAEQLWQELNVYARKKWGIAKIGFTYVPPELIMKDRYILFPYALVMIEEMKKKRIKHAPRAIAGFETYRTYNHLGKAVLDIGKWLRNHGIKCQPNHPLGGLVSYVPLAGKAGLGWQGMNGLLITPEFGQSQRIAPIYVERPLFSFTDSIEHAWVEEYCKSCKLCQKQCPPDAIQETKVVYKTNMETIGRLARCIDPIKCHPQFTKMAGCSICVKSCPFSIGNGIYNKIKTRFDLINSKKKSAN
jgi:Pyruvate/2-oxoacid:ferredoxin oxidoreductase delta subunit